MKIEKGHTAEAIRVELGRRMARRRLDLGITQAQVAREAGLGKRTVERIEGGRDAQVSSWFRLLSVLGLSDGLERLIPEMGVGPMDLKGKERKRASVKRVPKAEGAADQKDERSGWGN